jgi:hypothetical protein
MELLKTRISYTNSIEKINLNFFLKNKFLNIINKKFLNLI